MSVEKEKNIPQHNIISCDSDIKKSFDDLLYNSKLGDIIDYFDNNGSYVRLEIKQIKVKEPNNFNIHESQNFDEKILELLEEGNIGDTITYITNNQLGVRKYKIINESENKIIKEIGDIYGDYDSPDHPDNIDISAENTKNLNTNNDNNYLLNPDHPNYPNYIY